MSSELLTPYDPAKYLTDDEDIEVFLAEAEGTGDTDYIARARQVAERAKAMNQAKSQACSDTDYADLSKNQRGV
ncbi:hypothetical protein F753_15995 [Stutzerimonas chloritidismutans AW-1]|uniref:Addiction module antitoxin n=1 Tax=Stutzerimonas chloritidismutans AW-1 TaxID=1263865 RepID=V4RZ23_STUCH|nr:hypothetical protein [Stutzerimonas chloritidismutans]ESQ98401.1 hypothetical protein F753_15995 [Stutzerimonas chloritidismutans AW-1]